MLHGLNQLNELLELNKRGLQKCQETGERTTLWLTRFQVMLGPMNRLTKQEQLVLCLILGLLLIGWAVKTYRAAHPSGAAVEQTKS